MCIKGLVYRYWKPWTVLGMVVWMLTGCGNSVRTTTTVFFAPDHQQRGTIFVMSPDSQVQHSLAFKYYQSRFNDKLKALGYRIAPSAKEAEFIALVSYGIDQGKDSVVSLPVLGQMGGGMEYQSGTVVIDGKKTTYSGVHYRMPEYGVVGTSTQTVTTYTRAIAMDIIKADTLQSDLPQKVYEVRAISVGNCAVFLEVFDEMLEAMFMNFPNKNAQAVTVSVESDSQC